MRERAERVQKQLEAAERRKMELVRGGAGRRGGASGRAGRGLGEAEPAESPDPSLALVPQEQCNRQLQEQWEELSSQVPQGWDGLSLGSSRRFRSGPSPLIPFFRTSTHPPSQAPPPALLLWRGTTESAARRAASGDPPGGAAGAWAGPEGWDLKGEAGPRPLGAGVGGALRHLLAAGERVPDFSWLLA